MCSRVWWHLGASGYGPIPHTRIHSRTHSYTHTHSPCTHALIRSYADTPIHTYAHTLINPYTHTHAHMHPPSMRVGILARQVMARSLIHSYTHALMHSYHVLMHIDTHAPVPRTLIHAFTHTLMHSRTCTMYLCTHTLNHTTHPCTNCPPSPTQPTTHAPLTHPLTHSPPQLLPCNHSLTLLTQLLNHSHSSLNHSHSSLNHFSTQPLIHSPFTHSLTH